MEAIIEQVKPAEDGSGRAYMFIHLKNYNKRHDRWIYSDDSRMTNCASNKAPIEVKVDTQDSEHVHIRPPPGLVGASESDFSKLMELAALCPAPRYSRPGGDLINFPLVVVVEDHAHLALGSLVMGNTCIEKKRDYLVACRWGRQKSKRAYGQRIEEASTCAPGTREIAPRAVAGRTWYVTSQDKAL